LGGGAGEKGGLWERVITRVTNTSCKRGGGVGVEKKKAGAKVKQGGWRPGGGAGSSWGKWCPPYFSWSVSGWGGIFPPKKNRKKGGGGPKSGGVGGGGRTKKKPGDFFLPPRAFLYQIVFLFFIFHYYFTAPHLFSFSPGGGTERVGGGRGVLPDPMFPWGATRPTPPHTVRGNSRFLLGGRRRARGGGVSSRHRGVSGAPRRDHRSGRNHDRRRARSADRAGVALTPVRPLYWP